MSLGKLGMMLVLDYWEQFHAVKTHLSRSAVEFIKALEETVKIAQKTGERLPFSSLQSSLASKAFTPLELVLRYSEQLATRAAREQPAERDKAPQSAASVSPLVATELKTHIIESLIDALESEIAKTSAAEAMHNPYKIKALESVKQVLLEQHPKTASDDTPDSDDSDAYPVNPVSESEDLRIRADVVIPIQSADKVTMGAASPAYEEGPIDINDFRQVKTA